MRAWEAAELILRAKTEEEFEILKATYEEAVEAELDALSPVASLTGSRGQAIERAEQVIQNELASILNRKKHDYLKLHRAQTNLRVAKIRYSEARQIG